MSESHHVSPLLGLGAPRSGVPRSGAPLSGMARAGLARFTRAAALGLALAVGNIGAGWIGDARAQAQKSYTMLGLDWGSDIEAARAQLARAGFQVLRQAEGQQEEFVVRGLHAAIAAVDRGRRLVAQGRLAGHPVQLDLAFDKAGRLNHVIVTSRYWDGTVPGARAIVDLATRVVMMFEERYGPAVKRKEDGWIDTALWPRAADGSALAVYVRGTEGFMFSPSYKTALRIDLVGGQAAPTARIELPPEGTREPPKPRRLTKEQLRQEYDKDPSRVEPPPPQR